MGESPYWGKRKEKKKKKKTFVLFVSFFFQGILPVYVTFLYETVFVHGKVVNHRWFFLFLVIFFLFCFEKKKNL